jgi:hypothetical protein
MEPEQFTDNPELALSVGFEVLTAAITKNLPSGIQRCVISSKSADVSEAHVAVIFMDEE